MSLCYDLLLFFYTGSFKVRKIVLLGVVAAAVLAGCANTPRKAYNREGSTHVKALAVAERANKETYSINIVAHPGVNFGLIGGLVAAADLSNKSDKLTAALDPSQTSIQKRLAAKVAESLGGAGYQASVVPVVAGVAEGQAFDSVRANLGADALLDLDISGGYVAAGPSSDYLPFIRVTAINKDKRSGDTLYQDRITYGYLYQGQESVHLESDSQYRFKNIDDLVARSALARQGLLAGVDLIAAQLAADLKR